MKKKPLLIAGLDYSSLEDMVIAQMHDVITIDSMSQVGEILKTTATGRICKPRPELAVPYGQRGSGKSRLNELMWGYWDSMLSPTKTVRYDLNALATAQSTPLKGVDPLFEAMEKRNECIRLGKKAIAEMFHAQPIRGIYPTKGPIKAKDWE